MPWARGLAAGLALVAGLLAGCAGDKPKPTALAELAPQIAGRQVWRSQLDRVSYALTPAVREGRVFVAGDGGTVRALDALSGAIAWEVSIGARIAAGVGSDGRRAAVVTRDNELVVAEEGRVRWRARLPARAVTSPLVAGERVFVVTVNRVVHAFDAEGGQRLWTYDRPGDALTLAQPGVLAAFRDTLLVGQGARLTGLDPLRGTVRWEAPLANPRGANEVERLADLVGPPVRVGNLVCARAFSAGVGCADADRGTTAWTRNVGGWQPVGGDDQVLVAADASDRLAAWRLLNGESLWSSERLLHRQLGGVAVSGRVAVTGDAQGIVHFLDKLTGEPLLRLPTDGSAVVGAPALAGTTVVVVTRSGGVFGFRPD
ncbi:MAG: outer membrane protein assembly factor BamB [Rubrivivax sp.]